MTKVFKMSSLIWAFNKSFKSQSQSQVTIQVNQSLKINLKSSAWEHRILLVNRLRRPAFVCIIWLSFFILRKFYWGQFPVRTYLHTLIFIYSCDVTIDLKISFKLHPHVTRCWPLLWLQVPPQFLFEIHRYICHHWVQCRSHFLIKLLDIWPVYLFFSPWGLPWTQFPVYLTWPLL